MPPRTHDVFAVDEKKAAHTACAADLGVCQWFHYEDYEAVERAALLMRELGVRHLRTGISWADFHRSGGKAWYDWQMSQLGDFEVLLSVWHTPPSRAEGNCCNSPPRRLSDYADFIEQVIDEYGRSFTHLELWNEPNNKYKWDFENFDPQWQKFGAMIAEAAGRAQHRGVTTVLGGIIPVDCAWLRLMESYGALEAIDVIAIHGFPGMWWDGPDMPCWDWESHWRGWSAKLESIQPITGNRPIWITETGLATVDLVTRKPARLEEQAQRLEDVAHAITRRRSRSSAPDTDGRTYWYSLIDLDPQREAIEGFHVDENEYHMGLFTFDGQPKPALRRFREVLRSQTGHREL